MNTIVQEVFAGHETGHPLSKIRLSSMRLVYLFTAVVLGFSAWAELINQARSITAGKPWDLIQGIAFSLYAAYAPLMLLGVLFPLKMLPLLLLQLFYKSIWPVTIAYPLWSAARLDAAAVWVVRFFAVVVVLDVIVVPWPYVFAEYLRAIFQLGTNAGSFRPS